MAVNKPGLSVADVFKQLKNQHADLLLLESFVRDFIEQGSRIPTNPLDWQKYPLSERDAAKFVQSVINVLEQLACRFAHSTDDLVYSEATTLAQTVHTIVAERYDFQPCNIRIMSPTRRMEAAGVVEVVQGDDGDLYVKPKEL